MLSSVLCKLQEWSEPGVGQQKPEAACRSLPGDYAKWQKQAFSPFTFPSFIRQNLLKWCIAVTACKQVISHTALFLVLFLTVLGLENDKNYLHASQGCGLAFDLRISKLKSVLGTQWAHCHIQGEFTESSICNPTLHCHMLCWLLPSLSCRGIHCWACCPFWRQQGAAAQLHQCAPQLDSSVGADRQAWLAAGPHVKYVVVWTPNVVV